jgi:hypothetical protein
MCAGPSAGSDLRHWRHRGDVLYIGGATRLCRSLASDHCDPPVTERQTDAQQPSASHVSGPFPVRQFQGSFRHVERVAVRFSFKSQDPWFGRLTPMDSANPGRVCRPFDPPNQTNATSAIGGT